MIVRLLFLVAVITLALLVPWWVTIIIAVPYLYLYRGFELPLVMILVDGYYGTLTTAPLLSITTLGVCMIVESIKPYITTRNQIP